MEIMELPVYTINIDYPMIDFDMVGRMFLNGKEVDIKRLTKWSLIFEVGHEPRIEVEWPAPKKKG